MSKIKLELDYGTITIYNLEETWIQRLEMSPGYMLCYKDDIYSRKIIYRSDNKSLLISIQSKLMNQIAKGEKNIRL